MTHDSSDAALAFQTPKRKGLGRGLAALFDAEPSTGVLGPVASSSSSLPPPAVASASLGELVYLSPEAIETGHYQPRSHFDKEALEELAQSIREQGVIQPLLVRRQGDKMELVAGERRLRASQAAGLAQVPCRVLEVSANDAFEVALLENVQRADLSPLEEAQGYRQLLDRFGYTQETLAQKLGKSRTHMTNMLRLLTLPEPVQTWLDQGALTMGHARALVGSERAVEWARYVMENGLSVRETEGIVRRQTLPNHGPKGLPSSLPSAPGPFSSDLLTEEEALARQLSALTGLVVKIQVKPSGGFVQVGFKTPLELDAFLQHLNRGYVEDSVQSSDDEAALPMSAQTFYEGA
jgi:ParB family chromosome partitioning protein